jgi:hypothetical protein
VTLWDAARELTALWRARRPAVPARLAGAEPYRDWCRARDHVVRHFRARRPPVPHLLDDADRRELLTAITRFGTADAVEAAAWGLGAASGPLFAVGWAEELRRAGRWPVAELADGELFPADPGPWRVAARMAHPDAINTPADGQVPCVRALDGAGWRVAVSFAHEHELLEVLEPLRTVHGLHPNVRAEELAFGALDDGRAFGVTLPDDQAARAVDLCRRAWAEGARVTVLPELSATPASVAQVAAALDAEGVGGRLAVCGSEHVVDADGGRANVATAHLLDHPEALVHRKLVPFAADVSSAPASAEGIDVPRVRSLTLHQAGRFRLGLLICKDLLTDAVADQVAALGVNVLLVPAMSRTTGPFDANMLRVVNRAQALVAVVNGPQVWDGADAGPPAKLGRPTDRAPIVVADGGPPDGDISRLDLGPLR